MTGPARPRSEPKTPPEIDPSAPFGRDDSGQPIAKFGYKNDGSLRMTGAGRRSKDAPDAARVDEHPVDPKPVDGKVLDGDYTQSLAEAADGIWLCMTAASKLPLGRLRLGKFGLPKDTSQKIGAQAFVFSQHKYRLAAALNEAAKHNARARRMAEKMAGGDLSWVLTVGALALPAVFHSMALWKGDASLSEMELPPVAELAARNDAQMGEFMESLTQAAAMIQEAADAQAAA
jgi:hypothetical protein